MDCIYIRFLNPTGNSRTIIIPAKDRMLLEEFFGSALDICQKNSDINCCCLYPRKCDVEQMHQGLFRLYSSSLIHGLETDLNGDIDEKMEILKEFLSKEPNIYIRISPTKPGEGDPDSPESLFFKFLTDISPLKTPSSHKAEA